MVALTGLLVYDQCIMVKFSYRRRVHSSAQQRERSKRCGKVRSTLFDGTVQTVFCSTISNVFQITWSRRHETGQISSTSHLKIDKNN